MTWIRGGQEEALHLLKSAEQQLHPGVDLALLVKMRGLQSRILRRPGQLIGARELALGIHTRVLKREGLLARGDMPIGEDRLGDLYDLVAQKEPQALSLILERGLYYFLYTFFDLSYQQRAFVFDLLPKGLLVIDHGNVRVVERGLSRVLRRILEALAVSHQSKAELIESVWGYSYDASRHDALVYTSISKIRQLLGDAGTWIEADEKGYRLRSGVRLQNQQGMSDARVERPALNIIAHTSKSSLSFRQLRILATFDTQDRQVVAVDEVMCGFDVSRATATRDLAALTEEGFLQRLGRARATRYARTPKGIRE